MQRKDFYTEYYERTNRVFSDKMLWGKKEREEAWRKGQWLISKTERLILIISKYFILLLCWIPMCFDRRAWVLIPIALCLFLLQSFLADFSIITVECLYSIYRKDSIYCSVLYKIFLGKYTDLLDNLTRLTQKQVTGYVFKSGGKLYGKFFAVCRNRGNEILLTFKRNKVVVSVNESKSVIKNALFTEEQLLKEISSIINKPAQTSAH